MYQELNFRSSWVASQKIPYLGSLISIILDDPKESEKLVFLRGKNTFLKAMEYMIITERYEIANQMVFALDKEMLWVDKILKSL